MLARTAGRDVHRAMTIVALPGESAALVFLAHPQRLMPADPRLVAPLP
jgi:hypothetical protein